MPRMSEFPGVDFSIPFEGVFRVVTTISSSNGTLLTLDKCVEATNEQEAYEKVFGSDPSKKCNCNEEVSEYIKFFRET